MSIRRMFTWWGAPGGATRRRAAALRHGAQQRAAQIVFWRGRRETSRSAQQCFFCRGNRADRIVFSFLRAWRGNAQFWGAHCIHGSERSGIHTLFRARERKETLEYHPAFGG